MGCRVIIPSKFEKTTFENRPIVLKEFVDPCGHDFERSSKKEIKILPKDFFDLYEKLPERDQEIDLFANCAKIRKIKPVGSEAYIITENNNNACKFVSTKNPTTIITIRRLSPKQYFWRNHKEKQSRQILKKDIEIYILPPE